MDSLDSIYKNEIFLGEYRIEWSDQKIVVNCACGKNDDLEIFSDCATFCDICNRRYTITELIKVEAPLEMDE